MFTCRDPYPCLGRRTKSKARSARQSDQPKRYQAWGPKGSALWWPRPARVAKVFFFLNAFSASPVGVGSQGLGFIWGLGLGFTSCCPQNPSMRCCGVVEFVRSKLSTWRFGQEMPTHMNCEPHPLVDTRCEQGLECSGILRCSRGDCRSWAAPMVQQNSTHES